MFTIYHLIWLLITAALMTGAILLILKFKPSLNTVLTVCCVIAILSEVCKTARAVYWNEEKEQLGVWMRHMPFHLCSVHIFLILIARFMKEGEARNNLLAFIYPTAMLGAILALVMPTGLDNVIDHPDEALKWAFADALPYQFFLYHGMLIVLAWYLMVYGKLKISWKNLFITMGALALWAYICVWINGHLKTNFLFIFEFPVNGIFEISALWHWWLYMLGLFAVATIAMGAFYLPYILKNKKNKEEKTS